MLAAQPDTDFFLESHVEDIFQGIRGVEKIEVLHDEFDDLEYRISTEEDILRPLVKEKDVMLVVGGFYGDCGKGKVIAAIANNSSVTLIARVNSGENAGHTVWFEGKEYTFHLAPSGILTGKQNLIGSECVMDPVNFMNKEIQPLIDEEIDFDLKVGNVQLVTPYYKLMDFMGAPNSSTWKGMRQAHAAKVEKRGLRLDDVFLSYDHQANKIRKDIRNYWADLNAKGWTENLLEKEAIKKGLPEHLINFIRADDKIDYLIKLYQNTVVNNKFFQENRVDSVRVIQNTLEKGEKVLIEGSQGAMLSNNIVAQWEYTTSASVLAASLKDDAGYNTDKYSSATIIVLKTPSSRVGIGGNPAGYVKQDFFSSRRINSLDDLEGMCDDFDAIQRQFFDSIQDNGIVKPTIYTDLDGTKYTIGAAMAIASSKKHLERGATTGKPRVTGFLDCVVHSMINRRQGPHLSISALDHYDDYDKVGLVVAYVYHNPNGDIINSQGVDYKNGDIIRPGDQMPTAEVLKHCQPIIKTFDGWRDTPIAADKNPEGVKELPQNLLKFLRAVEHYTGAQIMSIGNGPKTNDLIYINKASA